MGVYNHSIIDTTPGAGGLFSPSASFSGTSDDYLKLMRQRYQDFQYQQLFAFQVLFIQRGGKVKAIGPFINEAKLIFKKLGVQPHFVE